MCCIGVDACVLVVVVIRAYWLRMGGYWFCWVRCVYWFCMGCVGLLLVPFDVIWCVVVCIRYYWCLCVFVCV